jgi:hypothetical protein
MAGLIIHKIIIEAHSSKVCVQNNADDKGAISQDTQFIDLLLEY